MKNKRIYIVLAVLILIAVMIWNVISERGVSDLEGNFREVAFVRNEQNSGPVVRIYAVTVEGQPWKQMEQYGNYMPHTKYGLTRIYFFAANKPYPTKLALGDNPISAEMREHCLAIYEKDGMGQVKLEKRPD